MTNRRQPRIVCLCGSTRFSVEYRQANKQETLAGRIVLTVGFFGHDGDVFTPSIKSRLDKLHRRKIDLADEILVLDIGGYIGSSTRNEIDYATTLGKPVRYFSKEFEP